MCGEEGYCLLSCANDRSSSMSQTCEGDGMCGSRFFWIRHSCLNTEDGAVARGQLGVAKMVGDVTQRESWLLVTLGAWVGRSILTCPEAGRDTPVPPSAVAPESTEWERNHCRFLGSVDRTALA